MKSWCWIFLVLLFVYVPVFSQTELVSDTALYYVNYATTGFINRTTDGNSYLVNNNLKFSFTRKNIEANVHSGWIYGRQETGLTNDDYSTTLDFNLLKGISPVYYWGLLTYDKSYSLKIDNRVQAGLGVGYIVVDQPDVTIVLSDGPLYEATKLYDTTMYQTVRNSFRIKYKLTISKIIALDGSNFLQNSLLHGPDYIIKANNNLSFKFSEWLSLTVSTIYNKLNISHNENFLCNFGFRVEKYF
jgi:hypothetical protein